MRTGLQFPQDDLALETGDTVALYTDGLTEARDPAGELLGQERLEAMLSAADADSLDATLESVWRRVAAYRGGAAAGDDATLLLARMQ